MTLARPAAAYLHGLLPKYFLAMTSYAPLSRPSRRSKSPESPFGSSTFVEEQPQVLPAKSQLQGEKRERSPDSYISERCLKIPRFSPDTFEQYIQQLPSHEQLQILHAIQSRFLAPYVPIDHAPDESSDETPPDVASDFPVHIRQHLNKVLNEWRDSKPVATPDDEMPTQSGSQFGPSVTSSGLSSNAKRKRAGRKAAGEAKPSTAMSNGNNEYDSYLGMNGITEIPLLKDVAEFVQLELEALGLLAKTTEEMTKNKVPGDELFLDNDQLVRSRNTYMDASLRAGAINEESFKANAISCFLTSGASLVDTIKVGRKTLDTISEQGYMLSCQGQPLLESHYDSFLKLPGTVKTPKPDSLFGFNFKWLQDTFKGFRLPMHTTTLKLQMYMKACSVNSLQFFFPYFHVEIKSGKDEALGAVEQQLRATFAGILNASKGWINSDNIVFGLALNRTTGSLWVAWTDVDQRELADGTTEENTEFRSHAIASFRLDNPRTNDIELLQWSIMRIHYWGLHERKAKIEKELQDSVMQNVAAEDVLN
ncbi:hypothetical protein GGR53DRAFT_515153 [Hypoxylon sp. FL1150]|nr:hypothetical protein GGR53DRAFT_515153 [Hypoxylon sp. FL1150]